MDQDAALAAQQSPVRRQKELRRAAESPPTHRARRGGADPAMVLLQGREVGRELPLADRAIEQEVMQHQVVQNEHAGALHRELPDRRVIAVVAHVVERDAPRLAGPRGGLRKVARGDLRIERLIGQAEHADVGPRQQMRQQVDAVVGDARAHGRERGEVVEAQHARRFYGLDRLAAAPARGIDCAGLD